MHRHLSLSLAALFTAILILTACSSSSQPGPLGRAYASLRNRFSSGQSELQKTFDAKKAARSWRSVTMLRMHPGRALETTIEVSCPDREHITTTLGDIRYESIRVGNQAWIRSNDGEWKEQPITSDAYPCGSNPGAPAPWAMMNEGRDPVSVVATMAAKMNAQVGRGDVANLGDASCQRWLVSFQHPGSGSRGLNYTICIGTSDYLPREVVMGSGGLATTYSDWNKPMQIDAPAASAQSTKASSAH
ncbi:MAG TPA: hypothetical protein VJ756_22455 [Terriglobales bacterium]|nr:hypothetical protein [Terriglobales bacterium]